GRFLEHSRIYYFHNNGHEEFYIGSADWMIRNLDYRVEAITPIEDPAHRQTLRDILDVALNDKGHAWTMKADGTWLRTNPDGRASDGTQAVLMDRTLRNHRQARRV